MTAVSMGTTHVRFLRGGVSLAEATVPGMLLELDLPRSVIVSRARSLVDLIESPDATVECCGEIILPWASQRGIGAAYLHIDPPSPFSNEDVRIMWEARNRISERHRPPTSGEVPWAALYSEPHAALSWRALRRSVEAAIQLLGAWPTCPIPAISWMPLEQPGRTVLVSRTERHAKQHAVRIVHGVAPTHTARRFAAREERRLHGLAALATLLADRISTYAGLEAQPDVRRDLANLFRRVAARSRPRLAATDPPPSTWPAPMSSAYISFLRTLTVMRDEGPGQASAPLSELWELYQAWVADGLLQSLTSILGNPVPESSRGTSLARWYDGAATVELRYQPFIPGGPSSTGITFLGVKLLGVIGNLTPDLLLVRREQNLWRAVVVDAKKRSNALLADDLSVEASKYLWGIRRAAERAMVPALNGVVLAAPLGGASAAQAEGLAAVLPAHPDAGWSAVNTVALLELVRGSSTSVVPGHL